MRSSTASWCTAGIMPSSCEITFASRPASCISFRWVSTRAVSPIRANARGSMSVWGGSRVPSSEGGRSVTWLGWHPKRAYICWWTPFSIEAAAATRDVRLRIAGWLSEDQRSYADGQFQRLTGAGFGEAWQYDGVVDRAGKLDLLRTSTSCPYPPLIAIPRDFSCWRPWRQACPWCSRPTELSPRCWRFGRRSSLPS